MKFAARQRLRFETALGIVLWILQLATATTGGTADINILTNEPDAPSILTSAGEVKSLSRTEAQRGLPVRLRGVVTYYDSELGRLFVQDETAGILAKPAVPLASIQTGDLVELTGSSLPGEFAPSVGNARVTRIGDGILPTPIESPFGYHATGPEDGQWMVARGVVRAVYLDREHLVLDVAANGGRLSAHVPRFKGRPIPSGLVDAAVEIHGVCGVLLNERGQPAGMKMFTPTLEQIQIRTRPSPPPFALPLRSINDLWQSHAEGDNSGHRVRVRGVVTLQRGPREFFIQDETHGLRVKTQEPAAFSVGDPVTAVGFPAMESFAATLQDSLIQPHATAPTPRALSLNVEQAMAGTNDLVVVQITGELEERRSRGTDEILVVRDRNGWIVEASLDATKAGRELAQLRVTSLLQITGVCRAQFDTDGRPQSVQLLLRSPADVEVVQAAAWWTVWHTMLLLAMLAVFALAAVGWIALLRARVREQTEQVRQRLEREAALEQRYQEFIECAQDLIFSLDFIGNFTACNQACERVTGYSRTELLRLNLTELVVPDQVEHIKRRIKGTTSLDSSATFDMAIVARNAQRVELEVNARVIHHDGVMSIQAIARDVTDRKQAEQAVRRSEELFKAFMRNNPAAAFLKDSEGRYVYVNRAWETQFPEARTDWKDKTDYDLWPVETAKIFRESDQAALAASGTIEQMETAHTPDGDLRYWMTFKFPVVDAAGRKLIGGMSLDLTDRYRAEEALRQSEALFSKAFHASPIAIAISTVNENRVVDVNHGFGQMLGYQRNELIGRRSLDLGFWVNLEQRAQMLETLKQGGLVRGVECQLRANSGEIRTAVISLELTELGAEPCLLFIAHDITEHLKLEDQLRHAQKMEAVGQLAAGVAHDFNNILTVIQGNASLVQTTLAPGSEVGDFVEQISQAAARAASLTRQLLMFGRKQLIQPRPLDLNELISNLTKMLGRVIGEHINLQFNYYSGLPNVFADPGMMEQIVLNLAVNARDAMPAGGRLTFSTSAMEFDHTITRKHSDARPGKFVCLTVIDTGCGMDTKIQGRIFEPFFTTKEVGKGTGLGLATVYGIVKQHQGWIDVQSQPGHGTTFQIFIPSQSRSRPHEAGKPAMTPVRKGEETILLVEDEPALCELVKTILLRFGYRVLTAANGVEALTLWERNREKIDLLLTDMIMPNGVSGRDLAARVQQDRPDLKVIFTSGYSAEMLGKNLVLEPGTHFLQKPYEPALLAKTLRMCLDAGTASLPERLKPIEDADSIAAASN